MGEIVMSRPESSTRLLPGTPLHQVVTDVLNEYSYAALKYVEFNSAHEGYAVIKKEFDELWHSIMEHEPSRTEAIQLAAMAIRFIIDVCDKPHLSAQDAQEGTNAEPDGSG